MSWLSGKEIKQAIERKGCVKCRTAFQGIYSADNLPSHVNPPAFYVLNTDPHNLPGMHWKVIFIDADYTGEVFDSLAIPPCNSIIRFMNKHSRIWQQNRQSFQHPLSSRCGVYVIYYVTQRINFSSLRDFTETVFSTNTTENERLMQNFYNKI